MHAPFELTEGERRLKSILAQFPADSAHWSEAQNRFQFVDRLLTECLGWEKPDIEVEDTNELGGKSDYLLGRPPKAIVEAKRESKVFEIPSGREIVRKIEPLLRNSAHFADAVHQVIPYCAIKGVQIAIVCNGPQLVVFQALVPGQSPLSGECFFFNGFISYVENFPILWNVLSPESISENRAYRELALYRNPRIPPKASTAIPEPYQYRYRNQFQENLRSLSSLLLEEIEDNPSLKSAFYKECYVPLEANNRHLLLSKGIIAARYRRASGDGVAPSAMDAVTAVDRDGNLRIDDPALAAGVGARPVIVVGDVGVGKTSFFEDLFESLESAEKTNTYFIHINLGIKANLSTDVKSYVLSEIPAVLNQRYGVDIDAANFVEAIYFEELRDFDNGLSGQLKSIDSEAYQRARIEFLLTKSRDRSRHLQAALAHVVHGRRKSVVLVLDNADQRTFAVQQETFLIAQELASSRNLLVFVSLRPSTYYQSKTSGALAAYQTKVMTISPPPADVVVERRLIFAARVAEGKVEPAALSNIRLHLQSVVHFVQATLRSIRTNQSIRQFLSNITGGNTRAVIELITGFVGSPNVDSRKIVEIEERTAAYKIPLHEFTKHALLGEYAYFNAHSSQVACNIFDVSAADPREHFLQSLVVAYLGSNSGMLDADGFLNGVELIRELTRHGFAEDQIRAALRLLARKRLIETPYEHYREIPVEDHVPPEQFHFRATSVGIYHLRFWTGAFSFLDAMSTDTPIFDEETRSQVSALAISLLIGDRLKRTEAFRTYLETQWTAASIDAAYYDFPSLLQNQKESFDSVRHFVARAPRGQ